MPTQQLYEQEAGWDKIEAQFTELKEYVRQALQDRTQLHDVERGLLARLLTLGRLLLEAFVTESGTGYTPGHPPRTTDDDRRGSFNKPRGPPVTTHRSCSRARNLTAIGL